MSKFKCTYCGQMLESPATYHDIGDCAEHLKAENERLRALVDEMCDACDMAVRFIDDERWDDDTPNIRTVIDALDGILAKAKEALGDVVIQSRSA